jgi:hypothetical protein
VIGLARRGRARPWQLAAAVTSLQRAFPRKAIRVRRRGRKGDLLVVHGRGALVVLPAFFHRCPDEAAIDAAIRKAAKQMARQENPDVLLELPSAAPRLAKAPSRRPAADRRRRASGSHIVFFGAPSTRC